MVLRTLIRQKTSSSCILECEHTTLVICMLNNIVPLHTLSRKIINSSITMCYAKCHNVAYSRFKESLLSTNNAELTISIRDVLRLLDIQYMSFRK